MTTATIRPRTTECPVCKGDEAADRYRLDTLATENGADPEAFKPSSEQFGSTLGRVVRCQRCGHGYIAATPDESLMFSAYHDAADPISVREEPGQVETARRALRWIEHVAKPGHLLDLGCWTGSFLVAARERGWDPSGIEPSKWARDRASERGLDVACGDLRDHGLPLGSFHAVVLCDVLEHLTQPWVALEQARALLGPSGALFITVPDAGSLLARVMGPKWWSVLPMHIQYFTRSSMTRMLETAGFRVIGIRTHPKVFSMGYYAERLAGYSPPLTSIAIGGLRTFGLTDRLVAPNFHDRMQVLATCMPS